jgi:hypothetical protein
VSNLRRPDFPIWPFFLSDRDTKKCLDQFPDEAGGRKQMNCLLPDLPKSGD